MLQFLWCLWLTIRLSVVVALRSTTICKKVVRCSHVMMIFMSSSSHHIHNLKLIQGCAWEQRPPPHWLRHSSGSHWPLLLWIKASEEGAGPSHALCVNGHTVRGSGTRMHKCLHNKQLAMGALSGGRGQEYWWGTREEAQGCSVIWGCSVQNYCTRQVSCFKKKNYKHFNMAIGNNIGDSPFNNTNLFSCQLEMTKRKCCHFIFWREI